MNDKNILRGVMLKEKEKNRKLKISKTTIALILFKY